MDPAVVASNSFRQLWRATLTGNYRNNKEQIFAQPLVYTPKAGTGKTQYVYISTTQNKVYKIDAKTGAIVAERTLAVPFLTADLDGCVDINPLVGNTATGVIDPDTDTWYLTLKTYRDQSDQEKGRLNGRYWIYAIDVNTLADKPNFPVPLEDLPARNNPKRLFKGGNQHQRPALLRHGQFIYAGFASHCVKFNFSGWLVGWDKSSGRVVESYAMQGGPESIDVRGGGIWMSGGGISSDDRGSMWFATGNGYASQLKGSPVPGRQPPSALEEAAVHASIQGDGSVRIVDFFMPYEKEILDGADQDLATSPLNLTPFSCPNAQRIGIITGKNSKTYFLNMDNLGGYCMSSTKQDAILGVYQNENSVYAGAGIYPISQTSGYVYINIIKYPTRVFQFSCDGSGNPKFVPVATSPDKNADVLGVGHGTTTSFPGKANSGLLWISDTQAIPDGGSLQLVKTFTITGVTKFQKPSFGDGIAYIGTTQGYLYAIGSPVNPPMECSSYDFGNVNVGQESAVKEISCRAKVALKVTGVVPPPKNFGLNTVPTLPANVAAGSNFTFTAHFAPSTVGPLAADVFLNITSTADYSDQAGISLAGTGRSSTPVLAIRPEKITFSNYITGSSAEGADQNFILANDGDTALTISSYQFSTTSADGPWVQPTIQGNNRVVGPFTIYNLPTSITPNSQLDIRVNFKPTTSGSYAVYLRVNSNSSGSSKTATILGTAANSPKAVVEFEKPGGGWVTYSPGVPFSFGSVLQQNTLNLKLRVTNNGGANAAPLSVTVSKPPVGGGPDGVVGAVNGVDLGEGTLIQAGQSATAVLYCSVPRTQVNTDPYISTATWTMNLNDPAFGKQDMQFICNAISQQFGPMKNATTGLYRYVGCFKEWNPGRQLSTLLYSDLNNTPERCIAACYSASSSWTFAGTQYERECWCGNAVPKQISLERDCNYKCTGSEAYTCGGNGFGGGGAFISLYARSDKFVWDGSAPPVVTTTAATTGPAPTGTANPAVYKNYVHKGCWSEPSGPRAMTYLVAASDNMFVEMCIDAAIRGGYKYCGVEPESTQLTIEQCNYACAGNSQQKCGAGSKFNYYVLEPGSGSTTLTTSTSQTSRSSTTSQSATTSSSAPGGVSTPSNLATYNGFSYLSCWTDRTSDRALAGWGLDPGPEMTIEKCIDFCAPNKDYIGVEDGRECWCGNSLQSGVEAPDTECKTPCTGNANELCGGPSRLAIYKRGVNPASLTSSTTRSSSTTTASSTTTTRTSISTTTSSPTTTSTSTTRSSSSTTSSSVTSTTSTTRSTTTTTTTTPTTTSTTRTTTSSSTTPSTTTSRTTTSTTTSTSAALSSSTNEPWSFLGCYLDSSGSRTLPNKTRTNAGMTIEYCQDYCLTFNLPYAGVENGKECWCSDVITNNRQPGQSGCTTSCAGDPSQSCGGGSRIGIHQYNDWEPTTLPQEVQGWHYDGCWVEISGRAIKSYRYSDNTGMTVEDCVSTCQSRGNSIAALQYAKECYCGNDNFATTKVDDGQCNNNCVGDPTEFCGAASRLQVYLAP
ncbi:hypothetical protein Dda_6372 [Drechslerella dactyloides]|uniref:WSC domain-containing protein n=1 Tax=Drechslerella dactyloides TaxID=74499 RepID=A0AAD6ITX6_DREDA|nr:hypothetical protein Dda_6372 [Drechslerella dactyloides]